MAIGDAIQSLLPHQGTLPRLRVAAASTLKGSGSVVGCTAKELVGLLFYNGEDS